MVLSAVAGMLLAALAVYGPRVALRRVRSKFRRKRR
jgi:hypothetical protein